MVPVFARTMVFYPTKSVQTPDATMKTQSKIQFSRFDIYFIETCVAEHPITIQMPKNGQKPSWKFLPAHMKQAFRSIEIDPLLGTSKTTRGEEPRHDSKCPKTVRTFLEIPPSKHTKQSFRSIKIDLPPLLGPSKTTNVKMVMSNLVKPG